MTADTDLLFQPFDHGRLHLPNRIVMAPMTRSFSPGGVPGPDVAAYYRRRIEGGVGLIIGEATLVDHPAAGNDIAVPWFHGEAPLAGWQHILDEVHAAGGLFMPQIWHTGTMRKVGDGPNPEVAPVSPSGLFKPGRVVGEPMTDSQIADCIEAYAKAAETAEAMGFDGVEIHGAHGYLIDQFFWEGTNQRSDGWGGDMRGRQRFALEVVKACRARLSPDFPLLIRLSQWKQQDFTARLAPTPETLAAFLEPLCDAGIDIFHCSTRRFWEPEFDGSDMNFAGWTKKLTGKPTITVGSVSLNEEFIATFRAPAERTGIGRLLEMMARGDFDLVAVGRALLVDADWAHKIRDGRIEDLRPYTPEVLKELV